jgi:hypothetical protein
MVNWRATYTYDANGNVVAVEVDDDADGTVNRRCRTCIPTTQTATC